MIMGAILFSYFIGSMINYSVNINTPSKILKFKIITIEKFFESANVAKHLRRKAIKSLEYNFDKTLITLYDKNEFFHELPVYIKI